MLSEQIPENPTQPQEAVRSVSESPVLPKKKTNKKIIAVLLILVLLLTAGGLYLGGFFNKFLSKPCSTEAMICPDGSTVGRTGPNCELAPCPEVSVSPAPAVDETANWKTYTNEEYGFKIKYPPQWRVTELWYNDGIDIRSEDQKTFRITFFSNKDNFSLEEYLIFNDKKQTSTVKVKSSRSIKIFDYLAIQRDEDWLGSDSNTFKTIATYVKRNDKVYQLVIIPGKNDNGEANYDKNKEIYQRILSTFKFLEEE